MFRKGQAEVPWVAPTEGPAPVDLTAKEANVDIDLSGPVTLNLDAIRDELVPEGWHTVKIERAEAKLSRQKKLPQVFVLSRITDEADPDFNRTVIWNLMLEGEGLLFTKRCFEALGLSGQLDYPSYQDMASDLVDREVEAKIKHRTHKGEQQIQVNNWREITPEAFF